MKKATAAKRKVHAKRPSPEESSLGIWALHLGKSLLITLAVGLGILLTLSLFAYFYTDPNTLILPLALSGAGLTALISGIITVKIHGHSALICGLLSGCLLLCVIMLLSLFFTNDGTGYSTGISCLLHVGIPILSVIGAYWGTPRKASGKHRK